MRLRAVLWQGSDVAKKAEHAQAPKPWDCREIADAAQSPGAACCDQAACQGLADFGQGLQGDLVRLSQIDQAPRQELTQRGKGPQRAWRHATSGLWLPRPCLRHRLACR